MRIIKLSPQDIDFPDRSSVDSFFEKSMPVGRFLLTEGRISEEGIVPGEPIIFSYLTEITHIARAASARQINKGNDNSRVKIKLFPDSRLLSGKGFKLPVSMPVL